MLSLRTRRLARTGLLLAGMLLALAPGGSALERQVPPPPAGTDGAIVPHDEASESEEILLELRIGRLASRFILARRIGDIPYIPAADLLSLGEIDHRTEADGTLRAMRQPGNRPVVIDPGNGRAWLERDPMPVGRSEFLVHDGVLYIAAPAFASLFDLRMSTDWSELTVVIANPDALPLGRRIERESRRAHLQNSFGRPPADRELPLVAHRVGGLVGDWMLYAALDNPEATASGQLSLATRIVGGTVRASALSAGPVREGAFHTALTYHLVRPGSRLFTQLRLGDGLSGGPRPRSLRGVLLTNTPHLRDPDFGQETFSGHFGPGWEVELHRHGRTIDMTRADEQGAWALDIPVRYGDNSVQVVAFGPHGEVVTTERLMVLREDRLPPGQLEWSLAVGECTAGRCAETGNLDLHIGISRRLTARAGIDAFTSDTLPSALLPYAELAGSPFPALALTAEAIPGALYRASAHLAPSPRLRARAAATRFDPEARLPALFDHRRRSTVEADFLLRPLASHPRFHLRGSGTYEERISGRLLRWQSQASLQIGGIRWSAGARGEQPDPALAGWTRLVGSATGRPPLLPSRLRPWFRAESEIEGGRVARATGRLAIEPSRRTRIEGTTGWSRVTGSQLTLSFTALLDPFRSTTQYREDDQHGSRTVQTAFGSFQWDEAVGGVALSSGPGVDRSGLSGFVYLDENANARWDPGEPLLEGVRVIVDGRAVETDRFGRYRIWDLPPQRSVRVSLQERSIPDPRWVPEAGSLDVELPPASFRRLDLRLVPSGEIEGRLLRPSRDGDFTGAGGFDVVIRDLLSGREITRVTTFSDGTFYATGIPPGWVRVEPDTGQLDVLSLQTERLMAPFRVVTGSFPAEEQLEIRLRPATLAGAGTPPLEKR